MGVFDGQAVSAAVTNPAFLDANADDVALGVIGFHNANVASGAFVDNIQREANSLNSFTGCTLNSVYNFLPTWSASYVGSSTDNLKQRSEALTARFHGSTGHSHDGTNGEGPRIIASTLSAVPLRGYVNQGADILAVTGTSTDVSTQMSLKTPSTSSTVTGVVVTVPFNKVIIRQASGLNTDDEYTDGSGNIVYGRITESLGVWTLSYYVDLSGVETPYNFTTSSDVRWYFQELYNPMSNPPVYSEFAFIPSDMAGSGSGSGSIHVTLYDLVNTTLPSGTGATIDGVAVSNNDSVLFTNLSSGNNRVYKVTGVGVSLVWTVQAVFSGGVDPSIAESVVVEKGTSFALQAGIFDGTTFDFNNLVRYFSGADYWEQTSIKTASLSNNTTGNIFSLNVTGSENIIVHYSIIRGPTKETGEIYLTSDGATAALAQGNAYLGASGVTFSVSVSVGVLSLDYLTDNSGSSGTMKYFLERWSDAAGGPGGPPNYTVTPTPTLGPITIFDNNASPTLLLNLPKAANPHTFIEYSVDRNGEARTGEIMIASNGTIVGFSDDAVESSPLGIVFSADISGANIRLLYTSTSTGFNGTFKYIIRSWN